MSLKIVEYSKCDLLFEMSWDSWHSLWRCSSMPGFTIAVVL